MRPLKEDEVKAFFEKLSLYIGENIKYLIENPLEPHLFRLIDNKVYYIRESVLKVASCVGRDELVQ